MAAGDAADGQVVVTRRERGRKGEGGSSGAVVIIVVEGQLCSCTWLLQREGAVRRSLVHKLAFLEAGAGEDVCACRHLEVAMVR